MRTPHDVRKDIRLLFWLAWATLYLGFPTRLYNGEVLNLYIRLSQTPWWEHFHPSAFAWAPILAWWMAIARTLGFDQTPGQELYFLQWLNGLMALLLLGSVYRWSRLMGARTSVGFTVASFVGANFTCWHWGTDVNPYLLMTLFGTWAVWCAWSYATARHRDRLYWSALFLSVALLIHLLSIVLIVPIWYVIWSRQEHPVKRKLLAWGVHFTILLVLVLGPYLAVSEWLYRDRVDGGLVNFVTQGIRVEDRWRGEEASARFPATIALGHFNLAFYTDDEDAYETYSRGEGPRLADNPFVGQVLPYVWLINTMLACIALFPTISLLKAGEPGRNLALFLSWTTVSFLLIGLINPAFGYLRLIYLPAMALLVGLWITLSPQTRKRPIQALTVLMLLWNFALGIFPNSVWGDVTEYKQAIAWRGIMGPGDLVILSAEHNYLARQARVFTGAERMLDGEEALPVAPPPGTRPEDFWLLDGTTLQTYYRRIYLGTDLNLRLRKEGALHLHVTRPPGAIPVDINIAEMNWLTGNLIRGLEEDYAVVEFGHIVD